MWLQGGSRVEVAARFRYLRDSGGVSGFGFWDLRFGVFVFGGFRVFRATLGFRTRAGMKPTLNPKPAPFINLVQP